VTNTKIEYPYSDASNYKVWGREVLAGTLTVAEKAEILAACLDGELFIASQVGLSDLQHQMWNEYRMNEDDHVFHRLALSDLTEVDAAPTINLTAPQLLGKFRDVAARWRSVVGMSGWDVVEAARQLGLERTR
jgi:hypothetical protein